MQPTHEERTMAALAHASIVANGLSLVGLLAAAAIWMSQRGRSAYVRAHALQALAYQALVVLVGLILALSWGACLAIALLPRALRPELYTDGSLPAPFWLALSGVVMPIAFMLLAILYSLVGAVQAYRGRPFRYPFLGRLNDEDVTPAPGSAAPIETTPTPDRPAPPISVAHPEQPAEAAATLADAAPTDERSASEASPAENTETP